MFWKHHGGGGEEKKTTTAMRYCVMCTYTNTQKDPTPVFFSPRMLQWGAEEQAVLQSLDTLFEPPAPRPASSIDPAAGGDGRAESKEGAALGLDEGHLSVFYESNV